MRNRLRPALAIVGALALGGAACVDDTGLLEPGPGLPPAPPPTPAPEPTNPTKELPAGVVALANRSTVTVLRDRDLLVASTSGKTASFQKVSPDLDVRWRLDATSFGGQILRMFTVTGDDDDVIVAVAFGDGLRVGDRMYDIEEGLWFARLTLDGEIRWQHVIDVFFHSVDRMFGRLLASGDAVLMMHQSANWENFTLVGDPEHSFEFEEAADNVCYLMRFDAEGEARWARAFTGFDYYEHPMDCSASVDADGRSLVATQMQEGTRMTFIDPQGTTLASFDNPATDELRTLFAHVDGAGDLTDARVDTFRRMGDWAPFEGGIATTDTSRRGLADFRKAVLDSDGRPRYERGDNQVAFRSIPTGGFLGVPRDATPDLPVGSLVIYDDQLEVRDVIRFARFEDNWPRLFAVPHPNGFAYVSAYPHVNTEVTLLPGPTRRDEEPVPFSLSGLLLKVPMWR